MEVDNCDSGQVTLSATDPQGYDVLYYLMDVTGGAGTAAVGLNSGIVTYTPDPADVGRAVQIAVEATNSAFQQGGCVNNAWILDVTVTGSSPAISCGRLEDNIAAVSYVFGKGDIIAADDDDCDNITYLFESVVPEPVGTYSLDANSGEFLFTAAWPEDAGVIYEFCVGATDGHDTADCCFLVEVWTDNYPGDVNFMDEVNISDAVFLVNYIFRGGMAPVNMNWADVNADCSVNISDAVYLIAYIFLEGPAPQLGCVYQ
jgi:hypothetical protein